LDGLAELFITSLLVVVCFPDLLFLVRVACTLLFSRKNIDIPRVMFLMSLLSKQPFCQHGHHPKIGKQILAVFAS
jgi:hypothetical protein